MQKLLLMKANYMKLWSAATYATIKYKSSRFDVSIFQENAHLLRQLHTTCVLLPWNIMSQLHFLAKTETGWNYKLPKICRRKLTSQSWSSMDNAHIHKVYILNFNPSPSWSSVKILHLCQRHEVDKKWPEELRKYAPTWLNLIWASIRINQHQSESISINQHQLYTGILNTIYWHKCSIWKSGMRISISV